MPIAEAAATTLTGLGSRIPGPPHRRHEQRADGRDIGRRRTGDAREENLRDDRHHRETAANPPDDGHREIDDAFRDAPRLHESAADDEEWDGEQDERVDAAENLDGKNDRG